MPAYKKQKFKPENKEGNKYDKIIKENLQSLIPALLRTVMHLAEIRLENLPQVKTNHYHSFNSGTVASTQG